MQARERAYVREWLDGLGQDFRFVLRSLTKSRAFTLVTVLSLALGIGVNTAVFTAADSARPNRTRLDSGHLGQGASCSAERAFLNARTDNGRNPASLTARTDGL